VTSAVATALPYTLVIAVSNMSATLQATALALTLAAALATAYALH